LIDPVPWSIQCRGISILSTQDKQKDQDKQRADLLARPVEDEENDHHTWASLCHFSALLGLIWWIPTGLDFWLPFGHLVGPLAVWFVKRNRSPFINEAGKESFNFQIVMTLCGVLCGIFLSAWTPFPLFHILVTTDALLVIKAGVQTSKGEPYRYPLIPIRVLR
jgi:uncharacterized Tic20 family protein